jgi:hypothetical protein
VNGTNGIKDIDIHLFYQQHPERSMMARGPFSRNVASAATGALTLLGVIGIGTLALVGYVALEGVHRGFVECNLRFLECSPEADRGLLAVGRRADRRSRADGVE